MAHTPFLFLFLGVVLIYVPRAIVMRAQIHQPEGLDNNNPRDQQARLTGLGRRANAAHQNMLEAFPIFAAGILASVHARVDPELIVALAGTFISLRALYIVFYLADKATARSAVWSLALLCSSALILAPLF
jgi:uncharacterized MAPEG superfamily protein